MSGRARLTCLCAAVLLLGPLQARALPPHALRWEVVERGTPRFVWSGSERRVSMVLRNTGTEIWSEDTHDHLGYHWLSLGGSMRERDGMRTFYPHPVAPGETIAVEARLAPPKKPGIYLLEWEPVREQVTWYGPPDNGPPVRNWVVVLPVTVVAQMLLGLLTLLLVAGAWWVRRRPRWAWWYTALAPPLWCWFGVFLPSLTVTERAGYSIVSGTAWLDASVAAILVVVVAVLPVRWRRWSAPVPVFLAAFVGLADLVYLRYFGSLVPISAVLAVGQTGQIGQSIDSLFRSGDAWLLVGIGSAILFAAAFRPGRGEAPKRPALRWGALSGWAVLWLAAAWPSLATVHAAMSDPKVADKVFTEDIQIRDMGVGATHLLDVERSAREWREAGSVDKATLHRVEKLLAERAAEAASAGPCHAVAKGDNLILIQVESLQQWVVGTQVKGHQITPFMDALRTRALYFSRLFDQTNQGRSSDGEFSALNSLHPLDRGAVAFRRPHNHFHAFPEVLREHGYSTISAHSFERGFWNRAVLHPRYGFSRSFFKRELGPGEQIGWGLADGVFLQRMVPRIARLDQPFFAFLITLGLHHPFEGFPDRHKVLDLGDLEGSPLGNYLHSMHYIDECLRQFVASLDKEGLLDHTVIAFYGDHDAGINPAGRLLQIAGWSPRDASTPARIDRVPFFVLLPGADEACRGERTIDGGHIDIAPTLLYLLGIPRPETFMGLPLLVPRPTPEVGPYGTAALGDVIWVPGGAGIPDQGACFTISTGKSLPLSDCAPLRPAVSAELEASENVVLHDMIPAIREDKGW